jgi:hypothetical protein
LIYVEECFKKIASHTLWWTTDVHRLVHLLP